MGGTHNWVLVALSILIAAFASFTALSVAARIRAATGWMRRTWLAAAALALGGGIWSMHFVAMLAFSMPGMTMSYELELTLVSFALAVVFTGAGFALMAGRRLSVSRTLSSGLLMGFGVVAMHYVGMAAMRMDAILSYERLWVSISVLIAVGAAAVAVWLVSLDHKLGHRLLSAAAMGAAISGMHYTGMRAAVFTSRAHIDLADRSASLTQTYLAVGIAAVTISILVLGLAAAGLDRALQSYSRREARIHLRLQIADVLRERETEEALQTIAALMGQHFGVARTGFGQLDAVADEFDYDVCWTDGSVPPLLGRFPAADFGVKIVHELKSGRTVVIDDLLAAELSNEQRTRDTAREVDTRSILVVPFVRRGQLKTIVYLNDRHPRIWHDDDVRFVEELAERTRLVVERMAVEDQLRELNATLEARIEARTAQLQQAEEALRHSQKMEAMGSLTGGVAHDFNNLLTPILGALDLLQRKGLGGAREQRLIEGALASAERARILVQRLLAFARRQPLKLAPVDVSRLVEGMRELVISTVGATIRVEVHAPDGLPNAYGDANQLEMAILNLSVNARDAMPEGGTLRLEVLAETVGTSDFANLAPGEYLRLSVIDDGTGMDEETKRRAVEPFFSTKGVGKGTGLGLSMAHGLAAQLGGALTVESELAVGTRVSIWLPRTPDAVHPSSRKEKTISFSPRSGSVLLVDDEEPVRAATATMLAELGFLVREASCCQDALRLLDEGLHVDLVITDYLMPGMNGIELIAEMKARDASLPALLITGYAERQALPGDIPLLSKPFKQDELVLALAKLRGELAGSTAQSSSARD